MQPCASSAPGSRNTTDRVAIPLNRYAVYGTIAAAGLAADLLSKWWVFGWLGMPGSRKPDWLWTDVVGFQTSLNQGALFGMGQGMWPVFALLSLAAAVGIFYWLFRVGAAQSWWLTVALAAITAGILGNLYDRLGLHGLVWPAGHELAGQTAHAVRDFILVMLGSYQWPNFNLADSMLVCGAAVLIGHSGLAHRTALPAGETADGQSSVAP